MTSISKSTVQGKLSALFHLLRPHQWIKNGFIWLPLFFGYRLAEPGALNQTLFVFIAFCLTASSVYVLNDLMDIADDRQHPVKKMRPLPSGEVSKSEALLLLVLLLLTSGLLTWLLASPALMLIFISYILLNIAYTLFLKHKPIIDIACIAIGFVLRVFAGGIAAGVAISHWIVAMTFLLALFLACSKRRDDLILMDLGHGARKSLDGYTLEFLSYCMIMLGSVIIVSYLLYTVSPEIIAKHGTDKLYLSAFWVILGLMRYMQITFVEQKTGSPTRVLLKDVFIQITIGLWLCTCYYFMYLHRG